MSLFSKDCEEQVTAGCCISVFNTQTAMRKQIFVVIQSDKSFNYYLPKTERALRQGHNSDEAALRICYYFKRTQCLETFSKHDKQYKNRRKLSNQQRI